MVDSPLKLPVDDALFTTLAARGFQVIRKLKVTGSCSVFRLAAQKDATSLSAAKVVPLAGLDAQGRAHAQQEVSFLKGIEAHPNLIEYRDSFIEDAGGSPRLVIVMSLAEDGDLRGVVKDFVAMQSTIPLSVTCSWLRQMLAGLSHMHGHSVVHRDLKSSNIFLSGKRRQLRIGDFGISRMLESTAFAESCVGTPAYMAPEVMQSERYDYMADMWSVGVIVYELCALRMPFPATVLPMLFAQVMEAEPDWQGFPESLLAVAKRLLLKEPSTRPGAAELLLQVEEEKKEPNEEEWASVEPAAVETLTSTPSRSAPLKPDSPASCQQTHSSNRSTTIGSDASPLPCTSSGYGTFGSSSRSNMALDMSVEEFQKMIAEARDAE